MSKICTYESKRFGTKEDVLVDFDFYEGASIDGTGYILAMVLTCNSGEPYAVPTVNLGEFIGQKFCTYVDTNNYPDVSAFLEENNIATKTPFKKRSGFCEYPLYMFNPELVAETIARKDLEEYLDCFDFYGEMNKEYDKEVGDSAEVYAKLSEYNRDSKETDEVDR